MNKQLRAGNAMNEIAQLRAGNARLRAENAELIEKAAQLEKVLIDPQIKDKTAQHDRDGSMMIGETPLREVHCDPKAAQRILDLFTAMCHGESAVDTMIAAQTILAEAIIVGSSGDLSVALRNLTSLTPSRSPR